MATPSTINGWLDNLSTSILRDENSRSLQDIFRRRVKRHNYARTNQFEVEERLDGLEEKFQILTFDNLSDALRLRRIELKDFEHQWIPDVLDLFVHLSGDPARNENLLELYRVPPRIGTPPPLRWKDVLADSPIDSRNRLWRIPDFGDTDDSGYDEDDYLSSLHSSPETKINRVKESKGQDSASTRSLWLSPSFNDSQKRLNTIHVMRDLGEISEYQLIREVLFFLRGFSSDILVHDGRPYESNPSLKVCEVSQTVLNSVLGTVISIRRNLDLVQVWLSTEGESNPQLAFVSAMKGSAEIIINDHFQAVDKLQQSFLDYQNTRIVSIISLMSILEQSSVPLTAVADFLQDVSMDDPICFLETLYVAVSHHHTCGQLEKLRPLQSMLVTSLHEYLRPIWSWVHTGQIEEQAAAFFVKINPLVISGNTIWHKKFLLAHTGHLRPPAFLAGSAEQVLACGKTSAFLLQLMPDVQQDRMPLTFNDDLDSFMLKLGIEPALPFAASLEHSWNEHLSALLCSRTLKLKSALDTNCGFGRTFDALGKIYFHQDAERLYDVEETMFDLIDRCMDNWNDRFRLQDLLEGAFHEIGAAHLANSITIHSTYTSSRRMQSRRVSVKILSALSFEYLLPWPVANIIDAPSMIAYRRIALTLMQIRRAKYCLEKVGYVSAMTIPLGDDATPFDQKCTQILAFTLVSFVNTVYDHLHATTIRPLTRAMRLNIQNAATIDDMIEVHDEYIHRLEHSCLAVPKLKVLRKSLITLLDLCIRFSDVVSKATKAHPEDPDFEVSSFTSAKSLAKRASHTYRHSSDTEDEDDNHGTLGEGFSSFIVLDEDTTIVQEIKKVKSQFQKHIKFFVAGLRGVARAGTHVHDLGLLADRLTWNFVK